MLTDIGGLRTLVRTGQSIEVRPGDFRNVQAIDVSSRYLDDAGELAYLLNFTDGKSRLFLANAGLVRGTDFFLRDAGPAVVDWSDADWKDSLDRAISAPGGSGTEIVTIERSNVRILADAGESTISIGRLNSTGTLELNEVLDGGPSLVLNGAGAGDSNIESLKLRSGGLAARHNVLLSGTSECSDGYLEIADDVSITNSASLIVDGAVVASGKVCS